MWWNKIVALCFWCWKFWCYNIQKSNFSKRTINLAIFRQWMFFVVLFMMLFQYFIIIANLLQSNLRIWRIKIFVFHCAIARHCHSKFSISHIFPFFISSLMNGYSDSDRPSDRSVLWDLWELGLVLVKPRQVHISCETIYSVGIYLMS